MKKRLLKILSVGFMVLSVFFFAFGLIKLARAQEPPKAPTIESGIPGVEVVQPLPINTNQAQYIIVSSLATLGLGFAGFVVSSRLTDEVSQDNENHKNREATPKTVTANLSPEASAKPVQETARQEKDVPIVAGEGNSGTITINFSPEDSAKLFEKAANQGKDISILAYELLVKILDGEAQD
jgi:hypothetical protein